MRFWDGVSLDPNVNKDESQVFDLKFLRQVGPRIFPKIINCRFRASNFVDYITFEHCNVWVNVYLLIGMHQTIIKHRFPLEL